VAADDQVGRAMGQDDALTAGQEAERELWAVSAVAGDPA
jgi:hypothetical protein